MATIVKQFEGTLRRGPRANHSDEWFDGQIRRFTRKAGDFTSKATSFRLRLQQHAWRRGLTSHSQVIDKDTVLFQAEKRNGT